MKNTILALLSMTFIFSFTSTSWGTGKYQSLRGDDVPAVSNPAIDMDWKDGDSSVPRTFVHQPPLIPHAVEEYKITTKKNDCLDCHGEKDSGAPLPHQSHFLDREGSKSKTVSSRWYFCSQCHVGQVDAKPLVENTFMEK